MGTLLQLDIQKQCRPHRGNKHRSINTLVLLRGESCRWPSLPVTLLFIRRREWVCVCGGGESCLQIHPGEPILHPHAAGMFLLFCVSLVFVYTSRPPQSEPTDLLISITNLTNSGMQGAKPTDAQKESTRQLKLKCQWRTTGLFSLACRLLSTAV